MIGNEKKITVLGNEYTVRQMNIATFAKLLRALRNVYNQLPKESLEELQTADNAGVIALIAEMFPYLGGVFSIAMDDQILASDFEKMTIADACEVIAAVVEVNDVQKLKKSFSAMASAMKTIA